jgi:hypothetical protein
MTRQGGDVNRSDFEEELHLCARSLMLADFSSIRDQWELYTRYLLVRTALYPTKEWDGEDFHDDYQQFVNRCTNKGRSLSQDDSVAVRYAVLRAWLVVVIHEDPPTNDQEKLRFLKEVYRIGETLM